MRSAFAIAVLMLCNGAFASSAYWTGANLSNSGWSPELGAQAYYIYSDIYGDTGHTWLLSGFFGHIEDGGLRLKHIDFSDEPMEPTFNWWVVAHYGDMVGADTFGSMNNIEDVDISDDLSAGGTLVENPSDFYMAFKASEVIFVSGVGYEEGETWYGWVHVSVDDDLNMTLLDEGINLYGGPVVVGAIPEPSSAVLMLVGLAWLALRRRRRWQRRTSQCVGAPIQAAEPRGRCGAFRGHAKHESDLLGK